MRLKNGTAYADAEKAKISLEEHESHMRGMALDCLNNSYIGVNASGKDLDGILADLKTAADDLKEKINKNNTLQISLKKERLLFERSQKELDKARGEDSAELSAKMHKLQARKSENDK